MLEEEDWQRGIRDSEVFLILGTPNYFKDVLCFDQAIYAQKLGKPFLVLLQHGVGIPKSFPIPADSKVVAWNGKDGKEDLEEIAEKVSAFIKEIKSTRI